MKRLTQIMKPIKGHNSFKEVMERGVRVKSENFLGIFVPNTSGANCAYFGVAVPKRYAKKAVVRNRAKRLMREALIEIAQVDKASLLTFEEFVLIRTEILPSHPKLIRLSNVKAEICELFAKAKMRIGKSNEALTDRND